MKWAWNSKHEERSTTAGMYLLRTSLTEWDEARAAKLYWTLSEVETTFRSLKSELGLRLIYHRSLAHIKAHLIVSVLACQACHYLRLTIHANGVRHSLHSVRQRWVNKDVSSGFAKLDRLCQTRR